MPTMFLYVVTHLEESPMSGRKRLIITTPEQDRAMGEMAFTQITNENRGAILPAHHPISQRVNRVMARLLRAGGLENSENWEVRVIHKYELLQYSIS